MKIIDNNPYRLLGVYSNSPIKERVANIGKMKAFLKVGKPVSFPLDLPNIISPITRDLNAIADAESRLTLPIDQIRYAQFWWMNSSQLDAIAFSHLFSDNIEMAKSIWEKKDNVSSLQNRLVLSLIQGDVLSATHYSERLYTDFSTDFIQQILGTSVPLEVPLWQFYIDTLIESGIDVFAISENIGYSEWKEYISQKTISPLIDTITEAIAILEQSKGEGPAARLKAGQKLKSTTKSALSQLKEVLPESDVRLQTIADKLGLEILQCGIDYYNESDDDDSAENAMALQNYADTIVIGSLAKERCQENLNILKQIIDQLPSIGIRKEMKLINTSIKKFKEEEWHPKGCKSMIMACESPLRSIKIKLGGENKDYLNISTSIANILLNFVIEQYNEVVNDSLKERLESNEDNTLYKLMWALRFSWYVIRNIQNLNVTDEFKKNRLDKNIPAVEKMIRSLDMGFPNNGFAFSIISISDKFSDTVHNFIASYWDKLYDDNDKPYWIPDNYVRIRRSTYDMRVLNSIASKCWDFMYGYKDERALDIRIEEDYYQKCVSYFKQNDGYRGKEACTEYIEKYPEGKYIERVKEYKVKMEYEYNLYTSHNKDIAGCKAYIVEYPQGWYQQKIKIQLDDLVFEDCKKNNTLKKYIKQFPKGMNTGLAKSILKSQIKKRVFTILGLVMSISIIAFFIYQGWNIVCGVIIAIVAFLIAFGKAVEDEV